MKNLQVKEFLQLAALCLFGFFLTTEAAADCVEDNSLQGEASKHVPFLIVR